MQQNVAKTGWELTKVATIGRSRSVYGQKRGEGGVGQSREPNRVFAAFVLLPTRFWPKPTRSSRFWPLPVIKHGDIVLKFENV